MNDPQTARSGSTITALLDSVVSPTLLELLNPGELESVKLDWRSVRLPVGPDRSTQRGYSSRLTFGEIEWTTEDRLVLDVVMVGEHFSYELLVEPDRSLDSLDLPWIGAELYSRLQDFIAESRFGWGELRGHR